MLAAWALVGSQESSGDPKGARAARAQDLSARQADQAERLGLSRLYEAEVQYTEITSDGMLLRHPSLKGSDFAN
jgi:hypothetical protein